MITSQLIDSSPFLSSFFGDLLAGLTLLVLGSWFIPKYLNWINRPKMNFISKNGKYPYNEFRFINSTEYPKYNECQLMLLVSNRSNKTIERFYWEIFVKSNLLVGADAVQQNSQEFRYTKENAGEYTRLHGYINLPIFFLENIDFPFYIKLKTEKPIETKVYYYFKTDMGQVPFWAWLGLAYKKYWLLKSLTIK